MIFKGWRDVSWMEDDFFLHCFIKERMHHVEKHVEQSEIHKNLFYAQGFKCFSLWSEWHFDSINMRLRQEEYTNFN